MNRLIPMTLVSLLILFAAMQLVPYRVENPPVLQEPAWDSPATEQLARRACFDCHSNEVRLPWYGKVAPGSWVLRQHVDEGREKLNLSEMNRYQEEAHESGEEVLEGEMPPLYYVLAHSEARLTDVEKQALARGLDATLGGQGRASRGEGHGNRDSDSDSDSD